MRYRSLHRLMLWALLLAPAGAWSQEPEIAVELPGGVPLEMVWIEPGTFLMGSPENDLQVWGGESFSKSPNIR